LETKKDLGVLFILLIERRLATLFLGHLAGLLMLAFVFHQPAIANSKGMLGEACKREGRASIENGIKIACLPKRGELVWQRAEWQDVELSIGLKGIALESSPNFDVSAASNKCLSSVEFGQDNSIWRRLLVSATADDKTRNLISKPITSPIVSLASKIEYGETQKNTGSRTITCTWTDKIRLVGLFRNDTYTISFSGLNRTFSYAKLKDQKWQINISLRHRT
jgi:hypothetical protein